MAAGVARRGGDVDVAELVRAAERDAAGVPAGRRCPPLPTPAKPPSPARRRGSTQGAATTDLSVLSGVLSGLSRRSSGPGDPTTCSPASPSIVSPPSISAPRVASGWPTPNPRVRCTWWPAAPTGSSSTWAGAGTTDFTDVSVEQLEARLLERLVWASRRLERPAGRYEVILPPEAVSDLMVALTYELSGRDAEDGRTVFSLPGGGTRVGRPLASVPFELRSDPGQPGLECAPFLTATASSADISVFDNGLPLGRTGWIAGGRLERLRYHRAGAARRGSAPARIHRQPVPRVAGATGSVEELVSRTERGLLLTCLWYIREVDPATMLLTGLTRDGVYVVEDGQWSGRPTTSASTRARSICWPGSARWAPACGPSVGNSASTSTAPGCRPIRVPDFNMSSVSQAS